MRSLGSDPPRSGDSTDDTVDLFAQLAVRGRVALAELARFAQVQPRVGKGKAIDGLQQITAQAIAAGLAVHLNAHAAEDVDITVEPANTQAQPAHEAFARLRRSPQQSEQAIDASRPFASQSGGKSR